MSISKNFILKEVAGEFMIIPVSNGNVDFSKVFDINDSGAFIYKALEEGKTKEEIITLMCAEYDAPKEVIEADFDEFVSELIRRGIYE